jgi:hypothetical protein
MPVQIESLEPRRLFSTLTANFSLLGTTPLQKPGLGSLFGVTSLNGGTDQGLLDASTITNSAPMDVAGVKSSNPFSLLNIASILRGTGAKTIVRYADMLSGFAGRGKHDHVRQGHRLCRAG